MFLGAGWAYNAVLKSTIWSALCFVVGFGVFPSLAPLGLPDPRPAPVWAWIAGAAFGLAVHFSNVLPDLEDDARTGVRGLPHRLGRRGSAVIAFCALIAAAAVVAASAPLPSSRAAPIAEALPWLGFAAVTGIALGGLAVSLLRARSRWVFRCVMLAALLLAAQLVVTGGLAG